MLRLEVLCERDEFLSSLCFVGALVLCCFELWCFWYALAIFVNQCVQMI